MEFDAEPEIELGEQAYQAVLLDLDGTLLREDGTVSARTRDVLSAVQRRGVRVMIATGRSVISARRAVEGVRLETPMLCYNGGALYCTRRERLLRQKILPAEITRAVVERVHEAGIDFFVNHDENKYCLPGRHPQFDASMERLEEVLRVTRVEEIPVEGVTRVTILGVGEPLLELRDEFRAAHVPRIYVEEFELAVLPSHRDFEFTVLDVHPYSAGKAEAVYWLEEHGGVPRDDVIAIGDGRNDLSMLRTAGLAAVPANAHPDALAVADRVLGHHDEDGVAAFLEEQFL